MAELLEAQMDGTEDPDDPRLRKDAGTIAKQYPDDSFPGHSAWLDWPWKLHRIQGKDGKIRFQLYDLERDPGETTDVRAANAERDRAMRLELETWLGQVVASLNGKDYT